MKTLLWLCLWSSCLAACAKPPPAPPPSTSTTPPWPVEFTASHLSEVTPPLDAAVLDLVRDAVVSITTPSASGSGVFIAAHEDTALLITNAHVVGPYASVTVGWVWEEGTVLNAQARVLSVADDLDLALLVTRRPDTRRTLELGGYTTLPARSALFAAGFPWGTDNLEQGGFPSVTVTSGTSVPMRHTATDGLALFIGGVNPGNSGGAAVDLDGRLRGVVSAHVPATELSQLIPAEHVVTFVHRVLPRLPLTLSDTPPRRTVFEPRWPAKQLAVPPTLVVVRSVEGIGIGAVIDVREDSMLVATASWLVGHTDSPVAVSSWDDGRLQGGNLAKVLLNSPGEGLALLRAKRTPGAQALTLPTTMPPLAETQPVWANLMKLDGFTVRRQGTLSAIFRGVQTIEAMKVDLGVQPADLGGLVFDAEGRLLGLSMMSVSGTNLTTLIPAARLNALLRGHLRGARLELRFDGVERCALAMTVQVTDPLARVTHAGVSIERGVNYTPAWREAIPHLGFELTPVAVKDGYAHFQAVISPCVEGVLSVQPFVRGDGFVERSPQYAMTVGKRASGLLIRGVFFSGALDASLPAKAFSMPEPAACSDRDWAACEAACNHGDAREACFEFGKRMLRVDPFGPRELTVALTALSKACREGLPLACGVVREITPGTQVGVPTATANERCGKGSLRDCLMGDRSEETDERLCLAGVGAACGTRAESSEDGDFFAVLGCNATDEQSCLRLAMNEKKPLGDRARSAKRACSFGLRAGCLAVVLLASTHPEAIGPFDADDAWKRACAEAPCGERRKLSRKDVVVGPSTILESWLMARVQRVKSALVEARPGNEAWVVDRPDMADIAVVQFEVSKPELLAAGQLEALKRAAPLATRCLLVKLSYLDSWMKQKRGTVREVVVSNAGVNGRALNDDKVVRCVGLLRNLGFEVPAGVTVTVRLTRG